MIPIENPHSLSEKVSKNISTWILTFGISIIIVTFFVSFAQSLQMFNKQVKSWETVIPQQAITALIDSDDFAIKREVAFIKSTELFSSFGIADNQKRIVDFFGSTQSVNFKLVPIRDEANVIWGYYYLQINFYALLSPFIYSGTIFLTIVLILFLIIKKRMKLHLKAEFSRFNQFLNEIQLLTEKIHEVYNEETDLIKSQNSYSSEQIIINRAISRLIKEIKKANQSLREAILMSEQKKFEDELTKTALQVAHDIGSPLAVLEAIVQDYSLVLPEESRIAVRHAIGRMRDIIHSLLKKAKRDLLSLNQETISQQLLSSLINQVVIEKRLQYRTNKKVDIHFDNNESSYGIFALVKITEFSRILSNLINNAVEAIKLNTGNILISLFEVNSTAVIQIKDNGIGITADLIAKLGRLGETHGKISGLGLGLYHAKTTIENWAGKLEIQSQLNQGTEVNIYLPRANPPMWFLPNIYISKGQTIVIIDDDESIHSIWKQRFSIVQKENKLSLKLIHLYSPNELSLWQHESDKLNTLYLCDYEFREVKETGIDIITRLQINYASILITSRFYMDKIVIQCEAAGIKILPKDMANLIPIFIQN